MTRYVCMFECCRCLLAINNTLVGNFIVKHNNCRLAPSDTATLPLLRSCKLPSLFLSLANHCHDIVTILSQLMPPWWQQATMVSSYSGDDNSLAEDIAWPDESRPYVCPHTDTVLVTGVMSHVDITSELSLLIFKTVARAVKIVNERK